MHVIATAGHVDHGKSALVRALTGMEPDRWAEEVRRGMTIDLGYAWATLPGGPEVAFVDVPGHERFMTNMLAGVGPAPAVALVVAADGGWAPQTDEHMAAVDALGVVHGVVAVTRSDLADPGPVTADVRRRLAVTGLAGAEVVAVSSVTGAGLDDLRSALRRCTDGLPEPDTTARVRLWIDRAFAVKGFGTVVTGTLGAGRVAAGDTLDLDGTPVTVRGVQSLGRDVGAAAAVARVALNLRGVPVASVTRGQALLTPGTWMTTATVDARLPAPAPDRLPRTLVAHVGSAAVPVGVRRLGPDLVRLALRRPLPLQLGDRLLLRDPGLRRLLGAAVVIDPAPPALTGRGATAARRQALAAETGRPDPAREVARRGAVTAEILDRIGAPPGTGAPAGSVRHGRWLVAEATWASWRARLAATTDAGRPGQLVEAGLARDEAVRSVGLPDPALLGPLTDSLPDLVLAEGRVRVRRRGPTLRPELVASLRPVLDALARTPFAAPAAGDLAAAGLGRRELSAAAAARLVLVLPGQVVLAPDAAERAATVLAGLPSPFTVAEAKAALGTTRRVAVPLLEHLDRLRLTRRVDDQRRVRVGV